MNKCTKVSDPRVTFAVLAYNQEQYIQQAVLGAFSQDYESLEIILSDDCSTDRTFLIMEEMADEYRGPHNVVLNRNPTNLHIGGHVKVISRIASGEIIVMAAGDDISLPERTRRLVEVFQHNNDCQAVFSDLNLVNDACEKVGEICFKLKGFEKISLFAMIRNGGGVGTGAAYAYRLGCFFWPWDYPSYYLHEDRLLPLRAAILGKVIHIPETLVCYRKSTNGVFRASHAKAIAGNKKYSDEIYKTLKEAVRTKKLSRKKGLIYCRIARIVPVVWCRMQSRNKNTSLLSRFLVRIVYELLHFDSFFSQLKKRIIRKVRSLSVALPDLMGFSHDKKK